MCLLKQFLVQKDSSLYSQNIIIGHCLQLLNVIQTYRNVLVNCLVKATKNFNGSSNNNFNVIVSNYFLYTHTYLSSLPVSYIHKQQRYLIS